MTTRKYKKLLMSRGIDRNSAEQERREAACLRRSNKAGVDNMMAAYSGIAVYILDAFGGNYRQRERMMRDLCDGAFGR